jgi:hypothetical protein
MKISGVTHCILPGSRRGITCAKPAADEKTPQDGPGSGTGVKWWFRNQREMVNGH